jgi:16S rRNA processing protein RimM
VLVVAPDADSIDKRERLIPYLWDDVVKQIDLDAGVISVEWGADFLA